MSKGAQIVIFEVDGIMADHHWRLHLINKPYYPTNAEWDKFFLASANDKPIPPILNLFNALVQSENYDVRIWSGRDEVALDITCEWLNKHTIPTKSWFKWNFRDGIFKLAPRGNRQKDTVIKNTWWNELSPEEQHNVAFAIDNQQHMVDFWKARNILCLKVHPLTI
jgi:hypothetical protein